ncbi:MAG: DUF4982 domain-containing protein [Bacteroidaceae bacterium]|nr:DUF4982 domain-containing protein [Bacteroidaceae bacterium]
MKRVPLIILVAVASLVGFAQGRTEIMLSNGWQFSRDGQSWQEVSVPHDWAISGPFDKKWDMQTVAIVQNGETEATEKTGRSGALPWIGEGFYKRTFTIPQNFDGHAELVFDGAMSEPVVTVNGQLAGCWAYGYNTFRLDVTKLVRLGDNLLEVSLKNMEESSRWYPGAGIYRPVKLVLTPKVYIDDWSLFVRTMSISKDKADLQIDMDVEQVADGIRYFFSLLDADGVEVAAVKPTDPNRKNSINAKLTVKEPKLWSPETPYLYKLVARLTSEDNRIVDEKTVNVGIRTVRVSREHGFQLNGQTRKIKGVCLHHDLGPLGAAVNKAALIRQVKMMKEMGCDAIRTSHNMPSQWQMEICDSLGMMVMAESFDMWNYPKCKNGYSRFFRDWNERDITNLVLAHRNHPCIVMWSIGNEVPEQWSEEGRQTAIHLQGICHALDPTRPVTQGCDQGDNALKSGFLQAMDIPGLNYRLNKYQKAHDMLTQGFLLGSETASTVSSRGTYYFPVTPSDKPQHPDGQCSGYDVEHCWWSNLPDDDWRWQDDKPWVIGEFVWTGFDYLGEPTPYDEYWPSRSSYFGICDLAGLPKDRYFLYRSRWNTTDHTIHLLPHWTWGKERRGEVTPVYCYTDYPSAELFVNGISQGRRTKMEDSKNEKMKEDNRLDRYRLRWNDVKYEPGELKVVVYDADGNAAGEKLLRTAGKPAQLQLDVWTQHDAPFLKADGNDLAFVTVSLTDAKGTLVPEADDQLTFEVTGAGKFEAVCNGDATSLEPFTQPTMKLFNGQLVVVVRSCKQVGTITLKVKDANRKLTKTLLLQAQNI